MSVPLPVVQSLRIAGPAGALELLLEEPASQQAAGPAPPARFAVICHPHPLFGGTLTNKVVHTVARACVQRGVPALRFNFRGVGASGGTHDEGRGEVDDLLAVVAHGRERWPGAVPWLAGFSFGAYVALQASTRAGAALLVTVAPPVGRWDFSALPAPPCPWLIVQGDHDDLVDHRAVRAWADATRAAYCMVELAGAEHFFHGRLHDVRDAVLAFIDAQPAALAPGSAPGAAPASR
jgi:alpha/beta superfamily hydrolase